MYMPFSENGNLFWGLDKENLVLTFKVMGKSLLMTFLRSPLGDMADMRRNLEPLEKIIQFLFKIRYLEPIYFHPPYCPMG